MRQQRQKTRWTIQPVLVIGFAVLAGCSSAPLTSRGDVHIEPASEAQQAQSLALRGDEAYEAGHYDSCAESYGRAAALNSGQQANDYHHSAVCLMLAGHVERALAALQHSAALGYHRFDSLQQEPAWRPLRDNPQWRLVLTQVQSAHERWLASIQPDVYAMFQADHAARAETGLGDTDWQRVSRLDAEHRGRVEQLMKSGQLKSSADYYHAAMIFQHGTISKDFDTAHELALAAVRLDPTDRDARWLAAATHDRALMSRGEPQRYGTQFQMVGGQWALYRVDPNVTDAERAQWYVPPLATAQRRAFSMNAAPEP